MKQALLTIVLLGASLSQASIYNCTISSPISKSAETWSFTFDTEKEDNKFIDIDIERQTKAGCVVLRAQKNFLSCGYGNEKNSVFTAFEDGTSTLILAVANESGKTLLSCVKQ